MISGFKASDIGQYGIQNLTWWQPDDYETDWYSVPVPMGATFDIFKPWRDPPARIRVPSIPTGVAPTGTWNGDSATPGPSEVPESAPAGVIDPEFRPEYTTEESAPIFEPGNEWYERTAATDWGRVYDQYVILNQPETEDDEVAIDWGWLEGATTLGQLGTAVGWWGGDSGLVAPTVGAAAPPAAPPPTGGIPVAGNGGCGPTGPKYGKICLATGVVTPLRRRRRRRLLTSSDIKDLSALKSIVGGAALQGAVVQAVRR